MSDLTDRLRRVMHYYSAQRCAEIDGELIGEAAGELDRLESLVRAHHSLRHINEAANRGWGGKCPACETEKASTL